MAAAASSAIAAKRALSRPPGAQAVGGLHIGTYLGQTFYQSLRKESGTIRPHAPVGRSGLLGHWMVFYGMAFAVLFSRNHALELRRERKGDTASPTDCGLGRRFFRQLAGGTWGGAISRSPGGDGPHNVAARAARAPRAGFDIADCEINPWISRHWQRGRNLLGNDANCVSPLLEPPGRHPVDGGQVGNRARPCDRGDRGCEWPKKDPLSVFR